MNVSQMPKHCTAVYDTYVSLRGATELSGMRAVMYLIGLAEG